MLAVYTYRLRHNFCAKLSINEELGGSLPVALVRVARSSVQPEQFSVTPGSHLAKSEHPAPPRDQSEWKMKKRSIEEEIAKERVYEEAVGNSRSAEQRSEPISAAGQNAEKRVVQKTTVSSVTDENDHLYSYIGQTFPPAVTRKRNQLDEVEDGYAVIPANPLTKDNADVAKATLDIYQEPVKRKDRATPAAEPSTKKSVGREAMYDESDDDEQPPEIPKKCYMD